MKTFNLKNQETKTLINSFLSNSISRECITTFPSDILRDIIIFNTNLSNYKKNPSKYSNESIQKNFHETEMIIKDYLDKNRNPNIEYKGQTLLNILVSSKINDIACFSNKIIELCIKKGADPNQVTKENIPLVFLQITNPTILYFFVENGANLRPGSAYDTVLIKQALEKTDEDLVLYLFNHGAVIPDKILLKVNQSQKIFVDFFFYILFLKKIKVFHYLLRVKTNDKIKDELTEKLCFLLEIWNNSKAFNDFLLDYSHLYITTYLEYDNRDYHYNKLNKIVLKNIANQGYKKNCLPLLKQRYPEAFSTEIKNGLNILNQSIIDSDLNKISTLISLNINTNETTKEGINAFFVALLTKNEPILTILIKNKTKPGFYIQFENLEKQKSFFNKLRKSFEKRGFSTTFFDNPISKRSTIRTEDIMNITEYRKVAQKILP